MEERRQKVRQARRERIKELKKLCHNAIMVIYIYITIVASYKNMCKMSH